MGSHDLTIGTLLVSVFFNTFLYGLVTYQFVVYYRTKFNDRLVVKCMVFFLFLLDTFHSVSTIYLVWSYTITNHNNPGALVLGNWPYEVTPICTALAALIKQIYLGSRIWFLTNSKILYGVIFVLAIVSFTLGFTCTVEAWVVHVISELPRITPIVIAWLATQVVVDVLITTILVITFSHSRTGFRRTDTVLNRLIRGAILTGLFAGIFPLGDLISFAVLPKMNLYVMFAIPIGRIHTNTIMDSLLSRESLKAALFASYDATAGLPSLNWARPELSQGPTSSHSTDDQHEVQWTIERMFERSQGTVHATPV